MFVCESCHTISPPRVPSLPVVRSMRTVTYRSHEGAVTHGHEIVQEARMCLACINHAPAPYLLKSDKLVVAPEPVRRQVLTPLPQIDKDRKK